MRDCQRLHVAVYIHVLELKTGYTAAVVVDGLLCVLCDAEMCIRDRLAAARQFIRLRSVLAEFIEFTQDKIERLALGFLSQTCLLYTSRCV